MSKWLIGAASAVLITLLGVGPVAADNNFDGTWKWSLDLSGHCYGLVTRPMTIKRGTITAVFTSPYVHLIDFRGNVDHRGYASVRVQGAFKGEGHGRFIGTEAEDYVHVGHPDGDCTGTWSANRISKN